MIGISKFKFRELKYRKAGSWQPEKDKDPVQYGETYILKIDEITEDGELLEGEFKIGVDETNLINKLSRFKPFEDITLEIYVYMKKDKAKLKVKDVVFQDDIIKEKTSKKLY